jgi:hypothetical protein
MLDVIKKRASTDLRSGGRSALLAAGLWGSPLR